MTRKPKPKSTRKRGGQRNNKNALRHGFFSKRFSAEESKDLSEVSIEAITSQINLFQVLMDRVVANLEIKIETYTDAQGNEFTKEHYLHQLNTLTNMSIAIGTHFRTTLLANGKTGQIDTDIIEAIRLVQIDLGIE